MQRKTRVMILCLLIPLSVFLWFKLKDINNMSYTQVAEIVEQDAVVFNEEEVSLAVLDKLTPYKVVMVGEYHNIVEHQTFLYQLATSLNKKHGFNQLLIEMPQAFSWIFEDYASGTMPEVDEQIAQRFWFHMGNLKDIRAYNLARPADHRLKVNTIDINNSPYSFIISLEYMQNFVNNPEELKALTDYLRDHAENSEDYAQRLLQFSTRLDVEQATLTEALGSPWFDRISKMIEIEQYSLNCRNYIKNNQYTKRTIEREAFIKAYVDKYLEVATAGVILNMGANHVQKTPLRGTNMEWTGQYLCYSSPYAKNQTYCLVVLPAKGQILADQKHNNDLSARSPQNEVFRLLSEYAKTNRVFLPFDDAQFNTQKTFLNFRFDLQSFPAKQLYDGVVVLPIGTYANPCTN